jgi:C_GCAxxG_C_C family probable redox protein
MKESHNNPSSRATEEAVERFGNGCNCSQAVLSVFAERYGLSQAMALRLASALGGGVWRMGGTCGTLTGAALVLGLELGPASADDREAKERTYAATRQLQDQFIEQHGSNQCKELLALDLSQEADYQKARETGVFKTRCPHFVETASLLVDDIIQAHKEKS